MWISFCKRDSLLEKYEKLSDVVSETWFKQRVFLALKHGCNQQLNERCIEKFSAWKTWCETARKKGYFEKKEILVEKIYGLRQERLLRRSFDAIKYGIMQDRFLVTRQVLNEKIPER